MTDPENEKMNWTESLFHENYGDHDSDPFTMFESMPVKVEVTEEDNGNEMIDPGPNEESDHVEKQKEQKEDVLNHPLIEIIPNFTGPDGYKCKECDLFVPFKNQIKIHIRKHTGEKPYKCDVPGCDKAYSRPGKISEHKKREHEKILQHACPICDRKFYCRRDKLSHIVIHDEARQKRARVLPPRMMSILSEMVEFNFEGQIIQSNRVCSECGKIFDTKSGKDRHVKGVCSRQFRCLVPSCGKSFFAQSGLNNHAKECTAGQNLLDVKNDIKKDFNSSNTIKIEIEIDQNQEFQVKQEDIKKEVSLPESLDFLNNHEIKINNSLLEDDLQHPPKVSTYPCDLCEHSLSSLDALRIHKIIHEELNRFKCEEKDCSAAFANNKTLVKHLKDAHGIETKKEGQMFHTCEECGKQCTTKGALQDHMLKHTKEKRFECMECGKKLKRKSCLTEHMKIHAGVKSYQCDQCGSKYVSSAALRNHVLSKHTDQSNAERYICSFCGKDFLKKAYLLNHIMLHTGEKRYECTICPKKFRLEHSLKDHMNMHNGIKPFQCPHCDKRFTQRTQMTMHVRRHTGDKRHKCTLCPQAFIEPSGLRIHMKKTHPVEYDIQLNLNM